MDDRLEKYIKDHRDDFDAEIPRKELWVDIEQQLSEKPKQVKLPGSMPYWRAAAVILLLITSWLAIDRLSKDSDRAAEVDTMAVYPELAEAEAFYTSMINEKREEISSLSNNDELAEDFLGEIDHLDEMYAGLKQDLNGGNADNLVDAMILNLQLRIEILNQQLEIIQSIENSQKDEALNL